MPGFRRLPNGDASGAEPRVRGIDGNAEAGSDGHHRFALELRQDEHRALVGVERIECTLKLDEPLSLGGVLFGIALRGRCLNLIVVRLDERPHLSLSALGLHELDGDAREVRRGFRGPRLIAPVPVRHEKDLLQEVVDVCAGNPHSHDEAPDEACISLEELLRVERLVLRRNCRDEVVGR